MQPMIALLMVHCLWMTAGHGEISAIKEFSLGPAETWSGTSEAVPLSYRPIAGKSVPVIALNLRGRKTQRWAHPLTADFSGAESIGLRAVCRSERNATLEFRVPGGSFSRALVLRKGEQIILLPRGSFLRSGRPSGWSAVSSIVLEAAASRADGEILLRALYLFPEKTYTPGDGLYLVQPPSRVHRQGTAWPMRAILDAGLAEAGAGFGRKLQNLLDQMYGLKLPLNPEGIEVGPETANVFLLGRRAGLAARTLTQEELDDGAYLGFIVHANRSTITIAGKSVHGTGYGLYRFFEKQGCRFYAPTCREIPRKARPLLWDCDFSDRPIYDVKGCSSDYSIRGWSYKTLGDPRIGAKAWDEADLFDRTLWLDHTSGYLVPKKLYYDKHPEYYALLANGQRLPETVPDSRVMLCLSNKEVLRISARRMLKLIESQPERRTFVVSQGDGPEWCSCDRCRALGNQADQTLHWANYVANAVARKYPDKFLMTNAYNGADAPPTRFRPAKNLIVLYAAWPNATSAPDTLRDFDARENLVAGTHLQGWLKVAPHNMGLYDYNSGSRYTLYGMAWRVKWGARRGMRAIWYCGTNTSFRELFLYVHCRLNWNPYEDVGILKNDFIRAYYGPAAMPVRELFDLIYDRLEFGDYDGEMLMGGFPPARYFTREFVNRVFELFDKALALSENLPRAHRDLVQDKLDFIGNCFRVRPGPRGQLSDDAYAVFARNLQEYIRFALKAKHERAIVNARRRKKPAPAFTYDPLVRKIWALARIRIELGKDPAELPPLVSQLIEAPRATVEKYRQTNFVERLKDGWRVPPLQFTGGQFWSSYSWQCPRRDNVIVVRGRMTDMSRIQGVFELKEDPPPGKGRLEIEGQDCEKEWSKPVPLQVRINGRLIIDEPAAFPKKDWAVHSWPLPEGLLEQGQNTIEIRNLAASDSLYSQWFMMSNLQIRFPADR